MSDAQELKGDLTGDGSAVEEAVRRGFDTLYTDSGQVNQRRAAFADGTVDCSCGHQKQHHISRISSCTKCDCKQFELPKVEKENG